MMAAVAEVVEIMRSIPLFAQLDDRQLRVVAEAMRERTVAPGQELVVEGQAGVGFFVIESGEAAVLRGGDEIRTLRAGDSFGEMALIDGGRRSATVRANSELTCHGLTAWDFRPLVEAHPALAWGLLETLVGRLREAESRSAGA